MKFQSDNLMRCQIKNILFQKKFNREQFFIDDGVYRENVWGSHVIEFPKVAMVWELRVY